MLTYTFFRLDLLTPSTRSSPGHILRELEHSLMHFTHKNQTIFKADASDLKFAKLRNPLQSFATLSF